MDYQSITSASYFGVGPSTPLTTSKISPNELERNDDSSTTDGSITTSTSENTSLSSTMLEKALTEAALPKNERNLLIVSELLKQELPINKNTILELLKLSAIFRDVPIETLVLMKKLNLPITEETLAQLHAYQQNEHLLLPQSLQLIDSLLSLLTESKTASVNLQEALFTILQSDCNLDQNFTTALQQNFSKEELPQLYRDLISYGISKETADLLLSLDLMPKDIQILRSEVLSLEELLPNDSSLVNHLISMFKSCNTSLTINEVLTKAEQEVFLSTLQTLAPQITTNLEREESLLVSTLLKQIKETIQRGYQDGEDSLINNAPSPTTPSVFDLLKSAQYQKLIKEELLSHFTFQLKDIQKKDSVPQFYRKYLRDLETLLHFFESSESNENSQNYQQARDQAFKMRDQIDFMKSINQFLGYVQMPVKLTKDYINSELFFYTNRRHARDSAQNLHVLLHLSMKNLGEMDIHLKLYKKTVHAKLLLEQKESLYLLNTNINQLSDALMEQGYGFTYEFEELRQKQTPVNRMFLHENKDILSRCYTFDTRA